MGPILIQQAAAQGDAQAQYRLGNMYAKGVGVPKDFAEAMTWLRKAAIQDHSGAQLTLGMLLLLKCMVTKEGVEDALAESQKWLYRAEAQGLPEAANLKPKYVLERGDGQALTRMIQDFFESSRLNEDDWTDFVKQMKP